MTREELIEESAKAAYEGAFLRHAPQEVDRWADLVADGHPAVESWREVARQVLAVFEKAQAPTDDERAELLAEADDLVSRWDRAGSWTPDSPIGLVMRLARFIRRPAAGSEIHADGSVCRGCCPICDAREG